MIYLIVILVVIAFFAGYRIGFSKGWKESEWYWRAVKSLEIFGEKLIEYFKKKESKCPKCEKGTLKIAYVKELDYIWSGLRRKVLSCDRLDCGYEKDVCYIKDEEPFAPGEESSMWAP